MLALGFILVMTWLALAILQQVRQELALKVSDESAVSPREVAYQLLELSVGVLAEIDQFEGGLHAPGQGWGFPLVYAGMEDTEALSSAYRPGPVVQIVEEPDALTTGEVEAPDEAEALLTGLEADLDAAAAAPDGYTRPVTRVQPDTTGGTGRLPSETVALALPPGLEARVRLFDESGKLSLTATAPARWQLFFEEMGFETSEGRRLTASLLDWMDSDDEEREEGAESETYEQLEPPYRAANRPLRDFRELRWLAGFKTLFFDEAGVPNEHYRTFCRNVSLQHVGEPNYNTASAVLLAVLAEEKNFQEDNVLDFLAGADMEFGTEDDRFLRPGLDENELPKDEGGKPITSPGQMRFILVEIAVSTGQSVFFLNALVDISEPHPGGTYPYRILQIVENQPLS